MPEICIVLHVLIIFHNSKLFSSQLIPLTRITFFLINKRILGFRDSLQRSGITCEGVGKKGERREGKRWNNL